MMQTNSHLKAATQQASSKLTDEQIRDFIVNGYVTVKADLSRSFHETIYRKTQELTAKEGNLGNNILPRVPELQAVFEEPAIRGALSSILGENYVMHSHRHPHQNRPHSDGQGFHKDSYWGYQKVRHHRPRWAMAFYYPQDSPEEMGPSAVLPGTQYYSTRIEEHFESREPRSAFNDDELPLSGEAGTVTIIHFDLWHRAMANRTDKTRYMMKFQFIRMDEPQEPEWNTRGLSWKSVDSHEASDAASLTHEGTWRHVWNWMTGESNSPRNPQKTTQSANGDANRNLGQRIEALGDNTPSVRSRAADELGMSGEAAAEAVPMLIQALHDEYEPVRLNAAYALGAIGAPAVPKLIETLNDKNAPTRRIAAYALAAVGAPAVPAVSEALGHTEDTTRIEAAYALAQMGSAAEPAIPALIACSEAPCVEVRRYSAEAFGSIGASAAPAVPVLIDMLAHDEDAQTRFESALALAQIGPASRDAIPVLATSLTDENRYVRDNAIHALKRIDTPEAESALFDYLLMARWCPITNRESTF